MSKYVIAIDQGTTSSRAIVFDGTLKPVSTSQKEFKQYYPKPGWVEHDAEEIWNGVVATCREAMDRACVDAKNVVAVGITNQRETTVLWDRDTGRPVHNAIVWQDRRTAPDCDALKRDGVEKLVSARTGLLLDPYFSATKVAWLLNNVSGLREKANAGRLAFGTVDSFLTFRLTGGKRHVTDATNASRTMLYNIRENAWDTALLEAFDIPPSILPDVKDCADTFGHCDAGLLGHAIPILGMAGDQQAAAMGNACFVPGMVKATYGTGCFALLNTGGRPVASNARLLTTIGYRLGGETTYALEGSIFMAGATVQWLRDELGIIATASESGELAAQSDEEQEVYLVPAFTGLGAPYWDAHARAAIFGLTRGSGVRELARAALESVCFQTHDLLDAMRRDWKGAAETETVLRVDGGMVASDWTMQRLADVLDARVERPAFLETTALGAAWLAGMKAGLYPDQEGFSKTWSLDTTFAPTMLPDIRARKLKGWASAVRRTLSGA